MSISKSIPGFESVRVVDGELRFIDGTECTLPVTQNNEIVIPIKRKVITATIGWIEDFAFHRVHLSRELLENLQDLYFVPQYVFSKKRPIATLPVLKKPILIEDQYRLIPRYSRYAIDKKGQVFDLKDRVPVFGYSEISGYLMVNLWDTAIHSWINVPVHRLIGYAWIPNDDFVNNYLINHIDGVKSNIDPGNLEWTSYQKNNQHAIDTGLRSRPVSGKMRDATTGEVATFVSYREACRKMGFATVQAYRPTANPSILLLGKYEIRLDGDDRPWFYETHVLGTVVGRYQTSVVEPDGKKTTYYTKGDFVKAMNVTNTKGKDIHKAVEIVLRAKPHLQITVTDLHNDGRERRETLKQKPPEQLLCITAVNNSTQEKLIFHSMRSVAQRFDIARQTLKKIMDRQADLNGWFFTSSIKSSTTIEH